MIVVEPTVLYCEPTLMDVWFRSLGGCFLCMGMVTVLCMAWSMCSVYGHGHCSVYGLVTVSCVWPWSLCTFIYNLYSSSVTFHSTAYIVHFRFFLYALTAYTIYRASCILCLLSVHSPRLSVFTWHIISCSLLSFPFPTPDYPYSLSDLCIKYCLMLVYNMMLSDSCVIVIITINPYLAFFNTCDRPPSLSAG